MVVSDICVDRKTASVCFSAAINSAWKHGIWPPLARSSEKPHRRYRSDSGNDTLSPAERDGGLPANLRAALALADDLISQAKMTPAAALGHKGGSTTARRLGADHYRRMAAARKTRAGGRPRKQQSSVFLAPVRERVIDRPAKPLPICNGLF